VPSFISFIPTLHEDIGGFFELAPLSSSDVVYDLGSGDGRLLFAALERERDEPLVWSWTRCAFIRPG